MRIFDTAGYLRRLHLNDPGEPSISALQTLHKAHVERVAYEALDIQLHRPTSIDPYKSAERIVRDHRGGYCYHLNGAFSVLLSRLGYEVVWHRAGVQNHADAAPPGADRANHLALTIHGLESQDCPSGVWLVDAGLGDALHQPIPLHEGTYVQGPFRYQLRRSAVEPGGWRLDHDPVGSFAGMDFRVQSAMVDEFTERHLYLSTSPDSGFVRTCCVMRRDATGIDMLKGCVLARIGTSSEPRRLETQAEWFAALADVFDLPLVDVDATARNALWSRVQRAHDAWLESRSVKEKSA